VPETRSRRRPLRAASPTSLRQRLSALQNLAPFVRLVWQTSPQLTAATLLLRLLRALLPVAILYIGKLIIDEVVLQSQQPTRPADIATWLASGRLHRISWLLATECALAVLADALARGVTLVGNLLAQRVADATSVRLMTHAATLDLETFENAAFQDQLERARGQVNGRMWLISQLFSQVQDMITVFSLAATLLVFAPWLIVLLAVTLVPAFLADAHFNGESYVLNFMRAPERRELAYIRETAANVETAKEVKIFGLHGFLIARYQRLAADFYAASRRLELRRAAWIGMFAIIGTVGYYLAFATIAWRTLAGALTLGDLTFLVASFQRLRGLIESLLAGFSSTANQAQYLGDLFAVFNVKPQIVTSPNARPFPTPIIEGFVFDDVGFKYPGTDRWAVRHLHFTLHAGTVLALVGENGAGKTTLVKLLARLYDPSEGCIRLDGHDLRDYDLDDLRANVGVIFQDFVRYSLSAGDNIAVGRIDARDDGVRIARAAARAQADTLIAKLPAGYDQMVGRRFDSGVELSGGEWQKIAIARAYMREADVLILDEPTAALDARAEYEIFQRFKALCQSETGERTKTAILISHRFSSVRMADRILVLANGQVEAEGTHAELLAQRGRYAELFELQAAGYR
jgi:ATP-binding cassette, subfamily B, bacterial